MAGATFAEPPEQRSVRVALQLGGLALAVVLWEVAARSGALGLSFPSIGEVWDEAGAKRELLDRSVRATFPNMAWGLVLGVALGFGLALGAQLVPVLRGQLTRFANLLNALPVVVMAPVLVTILGRDTVPRVTATVASFLPMFIATTAGLASARVAHLDLARAYGVSRFTLLRRIQLPAAVPQLANGLCLAAPAAVLGAVFGEWFGAERGLGTIIVSSMQNFQVALLWVAALITTVVSIVLLMVFSGLARWARVRFS